MLHASLPVLLPQNLLHLHALSVNDIISCRDALPTLALKLGSAKLQAWFTGFNTLIKQGHEVCRGFMAFEGYVWAMQK